MDKGDIVGLSFIVSFFFILYVIIKHNMEE